MNLSNKQVTITTKQAAWNVTGTDTGQPNPFAIMLNETTMFQHQCFLLRHTLNGLFFYKMHSQKITHPAALYF